jgi:hypothetical protein
MVLKNKGKSRYIKYKKYFYGGELTTAEKLANANIQPIPYETTGNPNIYEFQQKQSQITLQNNKMYSGGGVAGDEKMQVPSVNTKGPVQAYNPNSSMKSVNELLMQNKADSINDSYATTGGRGKVKNYRRLAVTTRKVANKHKFGPHKFGPHKFGPHKFNMLWTRRNNNNRYSSYNPTRRNIQMFPKFNKKQTRRK